MAKPGEPLIRESRRLRWAHLRRNWRVFLALGAIVWLVFVVGALFLPHLIEYLIGAAAVATVAVVAWGLSLDGGRTYRDGALGEVFTNEKLKHLRKDGWKLEHNIPIERRDIDCALIGERGAIALETKYTNVPWVITADGVAFVAWGGRRVLKHGLLRSAGRAADDLSQVLRMPPGKVRTRVMPVLVVWGRARTEMPVGAVWVDGVLVALGDRSKDWIPLLQADPLTNDEVERGWHAIQERKREHRPPKERSSADRAA